MKTSEYFSRMKELLVVGAVQRDGRDWCIRYRGAVIPVHPYYTHHGSRVAFVTFANKLDALIIKREAGLQPKSGSSRPMSPTKFFEVVSKIVQGEI